MRLLLALGSMTCLVSATYSEPNATSLAITLTPTTTGAPAADQVGDVRVELHFEKLTGEAGAPLLQLPLVINNVDSMATVLRNVEARDASGPLRLTQSDASLPGGSADDASSTEPTRSWSADRAVRGPLTVSYTVPSRATLPPRGPAPPLAFSTDGGGVSAAGYVFLPLPPGNGRYRTSFAWDLSGLPPGSRGITALGEGKVTASEPLSAQELGSIFFMAGRIGIYPDKIPSKGFFGAWQGMPPFDASSLLAWTGSLYTRYLTFFRESEPRSYGVFLRYNPINAGGGTGLHHSFVTTFGAGDGADVAKLRITLAHEMFHTFQPYIASPEGLESAWYGEGMAELYARRLALRFGMITPEAFLADLNGSAGRYYTSLMATQPNSEIPRRFWADTRIRTLPYDRGMLYLATVDDSVRKKSHGGRSLDDIMLAMLLTERSGKLLANRDWEAQLAQELGSQAVADFHAFLDGRMPIPASDAFGPCFERTTAPLRRYELGFDTAVLAEPRRIVRGLAVGSAAERAGLRNGDEIVEPVPQDGIQGNQTELLRLRIRRGGSERMVVYLPRGEQVQAYQWRMKADRQVRRCAI